MGQIDSKLSMGKVYVRHAGVSPCEFSLPRKYTLIKAPSIFGEIGKYDLFLTIGKEHELVASGQETVIGSWSSNGTEGTILELYPNLETIDENEWKTKIASIINSIKEGEKSLIENGGGIEAYRVIVYRKTVIGAPTHDKKEDWGFFGDTMNGPESSTEDNDDREDNENGHCSQSSCHRDHRKHHCGHKCRGTHNHEIRGGSCSASHPTQRSGHCPQRSGHRSFLGHYPSHSRYYPSQPEHKHFGSYDGCTNETEDTTEVTTTTDATERTFDPDDTMHYRSMIHHYPHSRKY